ncbi:uncharacterized protein [Garra rufa]|uniref:uncharacterized protein n=1 Tax=Garra rufa TaxID=137080 RepID=UPI003CCEAFD5
MKFACQHVCLPIQFTTLTLHIIIITEVISYHMSQLRFMVLGGDDALVDKACATILGERENRDAFQFGELKPRKAQVCGRQVSVLKTPFRWLEHLKSYFFFSKRVKSLKYDLQYYESLLFPGPHAFLLVHRDVRNSGSEYYLLRALSEVFGEKVLDYCMVIFIDRAKHNDKKQNTCLKMCGGRFYILQNTDVSQLFKKTETMTQRKHSDFFINHLECFRKAEIYFEAEYEEKMNKLRGELAENIETAENLKKDMNDMKELNAKKVIELNEKIKNDQKKSKDRENELQNELDALKSSKNQTKEDFKLDEELIIYKDREKLLLSRLDSYKSSEKQMTEDIKKLKRELSIYKDRERNT